MAGHVSLPPISRHGQRTGANMPGSKSALDLPSRSRSTSRSSSLGGSRNRLAKSYPGDRSLSNSPLRSPRRASRRLAPLRDNNAYSNQQLSSSQGEMGSRGPWFRSSPSPPPAGFLKRSSSEECLKCMLKVPHAKCEGHKYIRVGGGYRHSYLYVKAMMEELELQRQKELLLQNRLDAIHEHGLRAIKTYIRTKSGKLVERIIFMSEDDYQAFKAGGKSAEDIIKKYLSEQEGRNLVSWDKDEQKAITTWIRTKSGRRIQKLVYVSKEDYDALKRGDVDAKDLLKKYVRTEDGERIEGWGEAELKAIKTMVRTKSGRLVEKTILVSKEDYEKMQQLVKEGKDPMSVLNKYMSLNEGETLESWKKESKPPMKVVKAMVRTKSGRLVEKTILMTEDEYNQFIETGGDTNFLKRFLDLGKDDEIEDWEKASTVYAADSDDEELAKAKPGTRIVGKDGSIFEIVVDPITGKKYKKRISKGVKQQGKIGKGKIIGAADGDPNEKGMTTEQVKAYRQGKRRDGSDSEFSYKSEVSAGGTRHVRRRRKFADGTYGDAESYHSSDDEEGKARRQKRRATRKAQAIKEKKKRLKAGNRDAGSDSDFSYRSVVSAGGTRHVKRRRKRADGTYSDSESYHSSQDEDGKKRRKERRKKREKALKQGRRNADSDSDFSYRSVVSAGGTRHVKRRRKRADGTYSDSESYHSSQDGDGKERRRKRRQARQKAYKGGKRREDSDSDFSYRSVVSAGGTRHVKRRRKRADGTYSDSESYHSSQDGDGEARRRRRRRDRKHAGSAHSYYSVVSEGGTRHVKRKRRHADGTYSDSESYHSSDSDFFEKKKKHRQHGSDSEYSYTSEVSAGGTKRRTRKKRIRDKHGKVIGHGKAEAYSSPSDSEDDGKKKKKKKNKEHGSDSDYSYKSEVSAGGTRRRTRKKRIRDKDGKVIGHGKAESYTSICDMTDFSDSLQSTDSEDEPDISKMTEEERKEYLEAKEKRRAERERKRREKYGDKYDEMMEKHKKVKEAKKVAKSMVTYGKGGSRFKDGEHDDRSAGLGHDEWGAKGKKGKKKKDGNEADDESDEYESEATRPGSAQMSEADRVHAKTFSSEAVECKSDSKSTEDQPVPMEEESVEHKPLCSSVSGSNIRNRDEESADEKGEDGDKTADSTHTTQDTQCDTQKDETKGHNLIGSVKPKKPPVLEKSFTFPSGMKSTHYASRQSMISQLMSVLELQDEAVDRTPNGDTKAEFSSAPGALDPEGGPRTHNKTKYHDHVLTLGQTVEDRGMSSRILEGEPIMTEAERPVTPHAIQEQVPQEDTVPMQDHNIPETLSRARTAPSNMGTTGKLHVKHPNKPSEHITFLDHITEEQSHRELMESINEESYSTDVDSVKSRHDVIDVNFPTSDQPVEDTVEDLAAANPTDSVNSSDDRPSSDSLAGNNSRLGITENKLSLKANENTISHKAKVKPKQPKDNTAKPVKEIQVPEVTEPSKTPFLRQPFTLRSYETFKPKNKKSSLASTKVKVKSKGNPVPEQRRLPPMKISGTDSLSRTPSNLEPSKMRHSRDEEGRRRRKKKVESDDEESVYELVRDKHGNIMLDADGNPIRKKVGTIKRGKKERRGSVIDSDEEFEYRKDKDGNIVRTRKEDKGDYFETLADGTVRLKKGRKRIDISKISDEDLRKLGIDPTNMTKEEIARKLKEMFGDQIEIVKQGKKVGLKNIADYGSNADTDDLADDSDLDTSTLRGMKKVRVLMRRGGQELLDHMKKMVDDSKLTDEDHVHPDERDAPVDFMKHYKLVDPSKIDAYARAFVVEDDDMDFVVNPRAAKTALEAVPSIQHINKKQVDYVFKLLDIDKETNMTFRMFSVMTALAERVTQMDAHCKELLEIANLADIQRKLDLYRSLFYCNTAGDRDPNYIKAEALRIELMAGGLSWDQQVFVMDKMKPNAWSEVSFLDFLTYIPLFLSMHDTVCDNPLNMSNNQYSPQARVPSAHFRDQNPLGYPLKKESVFLVKQLKTRDMRSKADDLLSGKKTAEQMREENKELFNRYQKLPDIIGSGDTSKSTSTNK